MNDADLLIIGAGIAGASAAYFAARAGRRVLVIDQGSRASDVPSALINPVRGLQGRLIKQGPAGAAFTFALIDALRAQGHVIAGARGLWRPVADAGLRAAWAAQLPADYAHIWHDHVPAELGLKGDWLAVLELPASGWVDAPALLQALLKASGAEILRAAVQSVNVAAHSVTLADGRTLQSRELLWAGGALGALSLGGKALYRPGSVVVTAGSLGAHAVSHGLYATPCGAGSALGPTTESSTATYPPAAVPDGAMAKMIERATHMFQNPVQASQSWRGVRLARVELPAGLAALGPFGSRGFLLAPLQAHAMARHAWGLQEH